MELGGGGGGGGSSSDGGGGGGLMGFTRDHHNSSGSSNGGLSSMTTMMHISNNRPTTTTTTTTTTTDHHHHLMPSRPHHHPPNNHVLEIMNNNNNNIHLSSSNNNNNRNHITCFPSSNSQIFDQNNNKISAGCKYFMKQIMNNNEDINNNTNTSNGGSLFRAKIMSHPHYPRLLSAYVNCQKVGAPPEVVKRLEEVCAASSEQGGGRNTTCIGEDPALDQFMEAYCEMLTKYEQELTKPFKEAMLFLSNIESQLKSLSVVASSSSVDTNTTGRNGSISDQEEIDASENYIDPQAEDRELKNQLLRKYSGYLGSLKQEFLKKRKKGKLPKEARQQLLDWWSRHYKWPYPSETQKLALAESTGLDQKQINNWFINQRKRHWKPSEEMQFVVMDATNPNQYYIENVLTNPFSFDYCTQSSLL